MEHVGVEVVRGRSGEGLEATGAGCHDFDNGEGFGLIVSGECYVFGHGDEFGGESGVSMQRSVTGRLGTGAGSRELVAGRGTTQEWGLGIRSVGRGRPGPESGEVR
jgi:hypothetical protein